MAAACSVRIGAAPSSSVARRRSGTVVVAAAAAGPERQQQQGAVSRSQLLKGTALAAGTLLLQQQLPGSGGAVAAEVSSAALGAGAPLALPESISSVVLQTLSDCALGVSVYPTFSYNAEGYGGTGSVLLKEDGLLHVSFDTSTLAIPPISWRSSSILGIPVPPPLNIAIMPQRLEGTVDPHTGEAQLDFLAQFVFTAGPIYSAPPLVVSTKLTTEHADGVLLQGDGQRLQADGHVRLAGVARVPPTGDKFLDTFLMLPTDALAVLSAELAFS